MSPEKRARKVAERLRTSATTGRAAAAAQRAHADKLGDTEAAAILVKLADAEEKRAHEDLAWADSLERSAATVASDGMPAMWVTVLSVGGPACGAPGTVVVQWHVGGMARTARLSATSTLLRHAAVHLYETVGIRADILDDPEWGLQGTLREVF